MQCHCILSNIAEWEQQESREKATLGGVNHPSAPDTWTPVPFTG